MDQIAELMHSVLTQTTPGAGKDGAASKAQYVLDKSVSDGIAKQATDLVAGFPLYGAVDLG
jgi:glycine hydroxymethyltransferase